MTSTGKVGLAGRLTAVAALFALGACSPDTQDSGRDANKSLVVMQSASPNTVIAGAIAFVDLNENGSLDAFEPFAITNAAGGTNADAAACQGDAPALDCLLVDSGAATYLVRVQSGYETVSGSPFFGQYAVRVDGSRLRSLSAPGDTGASVGFDVVTTLQADLDADGAAALDAALAPRDELRLNALLGGLLGKVGVELEDGDDADQVGAVVSGITREIAKELIGEGDSGTPQTLENFVTDDALLSSLLQKVVGGGGSFKVLDGRADEIAHIARRVLAAVSTIAVEDPGVGRYRLMQLMVAKAARLEVLLSDINRDTDWFYSEPEQARALYEALSDGTYDLQALVGQALQGEGAPLAELARIPDGTPQLEGVGGRNISISRSDDDESIGLRLHFLPGSNGRGELRACLRYEDFTSDDGLETDGTLLRGNWLRVDSYTLVASLNILGARESFTIRRIGEQRYRFNLNDVFGEYQGSAPADTPDGGEPGSSSDCRALLGA